MRDGINLSANIYMPERMKEPLPVILVYTPYVNDEAVERGMFFAKEGYVFITLDLRGRGNSEGDYMPFEKDGGDGYDAINWIAKQQWCNGKIGMMGGSYRGMVQWFTLKEKPKALKTIVPTASVGPGLDFPKKNGIFGNYMLQWLTFTSGRSNNLKMFQNGGFWYEKSKKKFVQHLPFKDWDLIALGTENPIFNKWISHPDFDSYWQGFYPNKEDYESFDLPILTITGYFDGDQPGAMKYYRDHMAFGSESAKKKHYLLFGPWTHAGTRKPEDKVGGLEFGADAKVDMMQLHLEWFNWTLKDGEKPKVLKDQINYFEMNTNRWKAQKSFSAISTDTLTYYLSSADSKANSIFRPGKLQLNKAGKETPDSFDYDPLDTTIRSRYNNEDFYLSTIPTDIMGGLVYISDPLDEMKIFGSIEFGGYIELNVPDTDMEVWYYEIKKSGETVYLGNDRIRTRYRKSLEKAELIKSKEINLYQFKTSYIASRKFDKFSRIAVTLEPSNNEYSQKNYNSGGDVSAETKKDAKVAKVKLHHSAKYPSYIKIPVSKE